MGPMEIVSGNTRLVADVAGRGPEVILLHAGGERRRVWQPIMTVLVAAGFTVTAVDQRGHGDSGGDTAAGVCAFAADVAVVMAARGGRPVIVGASLGGLAATLALAESGMQARAAGLVLVDVVPDPEAERARSFLRQSAPHLAETPLVTDILGRADQLRAAAGKIRLPVLLVVAGDGTVGNQDVDRLRALIPHLQTVRVEGAGHLVARDAPAALAQALLAFLQSDPVRARHSQRAD